MTPGGAEGTAIPVPGEASAFVLPPAVGDSGAWRAWADALPASRALGLRCDDVRPDGVTTTMSASPWALNPNGSVFGGLLLAALDQTLGLAAMAAKATEGIAATASLTCNFLRPARLPIALRGDVVRAGRVIVFLEGTVLDDQGRTCCTCLGTWSLTESARGAMREPRTPS